MTLAHRGLDLWGKTSPGSYHPLLYHLIDVASVARARLRLHPLPAHAAGVSGGGPDALVPHLAFWIGLHDLGKATPAFQCRSDCDRQRLEHAGWRFPAGSATKLAHGPAAFHVVHPLLAAADAPWGVPSPWNRWIAKTISGHHGEFKEIREGDAGLAGRDQEWCGARRWLVEQLAQAIGITEPIAPARDPSEHGPFWAWLAGLTTFCDWVGSNTDWFPACPPHQCRDPGDYADHARGIADHAVAALTVTAPAPTTPPQPFTRVFGFPPRGVQVELERMAEAGPLPRLVIIEAPTGSGKTEAALYAALHRTGTGLRSGLYVALPTQATSNQMYARLRTFLQSQLGTEQDGDLQLLHGRAMLTLDRPQPLPTGIGDGDRETPAAQSWFQGSRRGLLAGFGVGTVDQCLLAVLTCRHQCLRLYALGAKTIIIDEVHAYDTYMSTVLDRLLSWLGSLNCTVILLSATLPAQRVRGLVSAFGATPCALAPFPRITWANADPGSGSTSAASLHLTDAGQSDRSVALEVVDEPLDAVCARIAAAATPGGCVAWICNTVAGAQEVYRRLRSVTAGDGTEVSLLHARHRFTERDQLERACITAFGKARSVRPHRAILVATQVVEQSLDLDFDLMVTDLAPVDLLIQRVGRLHRHPRSGRPPRLSSPRLVVRVPAATGGVPSYGSHEWVYDRLVLLRTHLTLKDRTALRLPGESEHLIEAVYGDVGMSPQDDAWESALAKAAAERAEEARKEEYQALLRLGSPPADWKPFGLPDSLDDDDDPGVHQSLRAVTRLALPNVELVLLFGHGDRLTTDPEGRDTIDPYSPHSPAALRRLLACSLRVSHQGVVREGDRFEQPPAWQRVGLLKYARLVRLRPLDVCWGAEADRWSLRWDAETGVTVVRNGVASDEE